MEDYFEPNTSVDTTWYVKSSVEEEEGISLILLPLYPVWENVRPRLEKIIADDKVLHDKCILETRRAHREGELRFVYREYLPKAPVEDGPFPTLTEICYVPEVKKLLDQDEAWIPMTEDRLLTALPALRERARLNKAKLAKLMWDHLIAISKPPKTEIKTLVMDVDVDKGDKGGLRRPKKRKVVDPKFLRGVPDGMEFGSEDILELATSLFHCLLCRDFEDKPVPGKSEAVYNYVELAQHIHTAHFHHRGYFRRPRVDDTARDILAMLGLPEDVRYSEVSGRVACKCPGFKHPSTFAKLVRARFTQLSASSLALHATNPCAGLSRPLGDCSLRLHSSIPMVALASRASVNSFADHATGPLHVPTGKRKSFMTTILQTASPFCSFSRTAAGCQRSSSSRPANARSSPPYPSRSKVSRSCAASATHAPTSSRCAIPGGGLKAGKPSFICRAWPCWSLRSS